MSVVTGSSAFADDDSRSHPARAAKLQRAGTIAVGRLAAGAYAGADVVPAGAVRSDLPTLAAGFAAGTGP